MGGKGSGKKGSTKGVRRSDGWEKKSWGKGGSWKTPSSPKKFKGGKKGGKGGGKKGGGKSPRKEKQLNDEELDKQLDEFMGEDVQKNRLDADLDAYFKE